MPKHYTKIIAVAVLTGTLAATHVVHAKGVTAGSQFEERNIDDTATSPQSVSTKTTATRAAASTKAPKAIATPKFQTTQPNPPTAAPTPRWYGDDTVITAERPRATLDLDTVGKRRFQVETSFDYQVESDTPGSVSTIAFPTQVRFGVIDPLELRVRGNLFTFQSVSGGGTTRGFGDLAFGTKWAIVQGGGFLPAVGLVADLAVPTGSDNVSNNTLVPQGRAIAAWELPAEFRLDTNAGFDYPRRDAAGDRFARFLYGAAVRRALPFWEHRINTFVELAGAEPLHDRKAGPHIFGTGAGVRITEAMQLDTFLRVGLNKTAANLQTGVGFSWKL
ncbi:MAG: transporter [Deltaproteobacteria bacterium]|nr:transporter [Deltaproteobacteria bacterium]